MLSTLLENAAKHGKKKARNSDISHRRGNLPKFRQAQKLRREHTYLMFRSHLTASCTHAVQSKYTRLQ